MAEQDPATDNQEQPPDQSQGEGLKFEDALTNLEQIVAKMEKGELSLQQMMQKFEEGMKLAKYCSNKLNETEKKIELLMKQNEDESEWQELEGPESLSQDQNSPNTESDEDNSAE